MPRNATCESCAADLRCCRTCRFYDPSAYNACTEPAADRVLEKDRANFCDFYAPVGIATRAPVGSANPGALAELERLFGKK